MYMSLPPVNRGYIPAMKLFILFLLIAVLPISLHARPLFLLLVDDLPDVLSASDDADDSHSAFDEFPDSGPEPYSVVDPGSWTHIFEPPGCVNGTVSNENDVRNDRDGVYCEGLRKMLEAGRGGGHAVMEEAASAIEKAAAAGQPHAQSMIGFWYNTGITRERSQTKALLYHSFAAEGGNLQSKMVMAYNYLRQQMYEEAVKLYAELAEVAVNSFLISKDSPVETIRIHEENKGALSEYTGEEEKKFQMLEFRADKGYAGDMHDLGMCYYFGLKGVTRDHAKAFAWFSKAVEKGDAKSMEILGEIYASGVGVERNYTKALELLTLASKQKLYSAYNGMGYLYVKGYGVERNYTKAKEYFQKAAENNEPGGFYNLGVIYFKGIGVKRNLKKACNYLLIAFKAGQPKALYQLAKMFDAGVDVKKNVQSAISLYKQVAELGPWSSLFRWALKSYLQGDISSSFLLYSRLAEMGYEVAQSNAAWILDKYGEKSMCMGESGMCTAAERHRLAHALWWQASEQGNQQAALLIGDAYFYGRGIERDYVRAAEAYKHAKAKLNGQAIFNLGYMHEHGLGLPLDLHLAKRYYDQVLQVDAQAKLPVALARASLWIRMNYADSFLVNMIDVLPEVFPKVDAWIKDVVMEEGNATIITLSVCLLTILYLRQRQRRHVAAVALVPPPQPRQ